MLLTVSGYPQKEYNNWYFGYYAGLSFQSGNPIPMTNSAMSQVEGCASISDKNGNLLFYTDGMNVYTNENNLMPNGSGLAGGLSSSQSALIVKKPLCDRYFYILLYQLREVLLELAIQLWI